MTFTYDPALTSDLDWVRFHLGDINDEGAYLPDETISALLTELGSVELTVLAGIKHILSLLSVPNFRKDWLQVDYEKARNGFSDLLKRKSTEFSISLHGIPASIVKRPSRKDSYMDDDDLDWSTPAGGTTNAGW